MHKFLSLDWTRVPKTDRQNIKNQICEDEGFIEYCKNKKDWTYEEHDKLVYTLEPEKGYGGYYYDIYNRQISYNGIKTIKKAGTKLALSDVHKNEIEKCKTDLKYFRKYYVKIQTRKGKKRPDLREYQANLEDSLIKMDDLAVSFSRQSGKTITVGSYLLWRGNFHPQMMNIGIVANKPRTAREVLGKIKQMFLELPIWMMQCIEVWNKSDIELADTGTRYLTDSPSGDSFRGDTISLLFCDEVAYIPIGLWEEMLDSIIPTMSSLSFKQLIYTSTAKGKNHWARIVELGRKNLNGMTVIENDWRDVPHYDKDNNLLDPEVYRKNVEKKHGKKFFLQTEENEFLGSSDTLVNGDSLLGVDNNLDIRKIIPQSILNNGEMYHQVKEGHSYIVSVDPSKDGIDDFSVAVTDVTSFPFEQVFTANLQIDYLMMPEHLNELGNYYNTALIIVEGNEGAGQSITDTLFNIYSYENLYKDKNIDGKPGYKKYTGFRTTQRSRPLVLNMLKIFIEEGKLIINSRTMLNQLYTFSKRKTGNKYEAEDGYRDDAVMAQAIMFAPFMHIKVFDDFEMFTRELHVIGSEQKVSDFLSVLDLGFTSDDDDADQKAEQLRLMRLEFQGANDDYGVSESF